MKHFQGTLWLAGTLFSGACIAEGPQSSAGLPARSDTSESLEEVNITGTFIRGAESSASPLRTFDREAIEESGLTTTQEFLGSLPQNFRGGLSEAGGGPAGGLTQGGPLTGNNIGMTNLAFASGVNLHGLGNSSTLVLLDGMRIATTDGGSSVDLGAIPLSALKQIDVLTDSASALYGSDAVGGVVNLHLRDDYSGQETRLRYGSSTEGGGAERQASQTVGRNWGSGSALLNYEYYRRSFVDARERSFTSELPSPTFLLPQTDRHSVLLTGRQELAPRVKVFGTGLYSMRIADSMTSNDLGPELWINDHHGKVEQYSLIGGGSIDRGETWRISLTMDYSSNDTSRRQEQLRGSMGSVTFIDGERTSVKSADAKADGSLFEWRGQSIKAAVGGHARREAYDNGGNVNASRSSRAGFGELRVPFVLDPQRAVDSPRVELSVAARYEEYSDFGSSTDPKVGLMFALPAQGVNFRSTWGTSFRAPLLTELNGPVQGLLFPLPNPSGGMTLTAIAIGSNPGLKPEEAETFTAGVDLRPDVLPGFSASATYFRVNYRHRIEAARALFDALLDPQFTDIVKAPDATLLTLLSQQPDSFNPTGANWHDAQLLVDNRNLNTASLGTSGVDLLLTYTLPLDTSQFSFGLDSTYLFEKTIQLSGSVPGRDVLNTVDNPVDLRMRGNVTWNYGPWSLAAFIDYVDNYKDVRFVPTAEVSSWTTLDLNLRYRLSTANQWIGDTELAVAVQNALNEDPPWVRDLDPSRRGGVHFDSANAWPSGRTIAVQATVSW